jgi:hypothetical protein
MNANDQLRDYNCTEHYYRYHNSFVYTDGVKAMCEKFECWWFLDVIVSYQWNLKAEQFQAWTLSLTGELEAVVKCDNGNGKELAKQEIPLTDFKPSLATIWVENGVALLPSEH